MYGYESWTIKKAECWRIDVFELWCWRRLLEVPWIARRSNQSILKEISPEYSLEGLMLKLKLQYFGHLMQRTDSLEKTRCWERLKAGGEGDDRGWDGWMAPLTWWTWVWASSGRWWWTGKPGMLAVHGVAKIWTWLSDWTEPSYQRGVLLSVSMFSLSRKLCVCVVGGSKGQRKLRTVIQMWNEGMFWFIKRVDFYWQMNLHLATLNSYLPLMNHSGCIQTLFHHVLETSMWMTHQAWLSTQSVSLCRMNSMTWAMPYSLQIHLVPSFTPGFGKQ